ncbi:hypothetical protein [Stappia sp.]|uniref:hypothetical protein n=1 Tax=Stappia sp. TaxID=1870903 RepID=UPI003D0B6E81
MSHGFRINIRREFAFERMNLLSRQIETPASFLGNFKLQDTTVYRMGAAGNRAGRLQLGDDRIHRLRRQQGHARFQTMAPDAYERLAGLGKAVDASGLDKELTKPVKVRVSLRNACTFCTALHQGMPA